MSGFRPAARQADPTLSGCLRTTIGWPALTPNPDIPLCACGRFATGRCQLGDEWICDHHVWWPYSSPEVPYRPIVFDTSWPEFKKSAARAADDEIQAAWNAAGQPMYCLTCVAATIRTAVSAATASKKGLPPDDVDAIALRLDPAAWAAHGLDVARYGSDPRHALIEESQKRVAARFGQDPAYTAEVVRRLAAATARQIPFQMDGWFEFCRYVLKTEQRQLGYDGLTSTDDTEYVAWSMTADGDLRVRTVGPPKGLFASKPSISVGPLKPSAEVFEQLLWSLGTGRPRRITGAPRG